jgi:MFS family permease
VGRVHGTGSFVGDLRVVLGGTGFRRLFAVRLVSQAGDGLFQVALASLFFFSPERQSSPEAVAVAFAVLLLPFTIVGPWAGILLDRWRRRQVLLWANLLRAVGVLATASLVATTEPGLALYVLVLACLSVNRFLLAGLSASLPHVVPPDELVMANSVSPTSGSAAAFLGGAAGFALRPLVGAGDHGDALLLVGAAAVFTVGGLLALRIGPDDLGPDAPAAASLADRFRGVWAEVVAGARHVADRGTPAWALAAIGAHRLAYGLSFIATILLARNRLTEPGDTVAALALLGAVLAASGAGFVVAAVLTPVGTRRTGPSGWIVVCLAAAAVTEAVLVVALTVPLLLAAAFALGVTAQGAKISVDTIVQRDTDDAFRGRVFVLYDIVFNAAFVAAAAAAGVVVPDDGYSRVLYAGIAAWYGAAALAYRRTLPTPLPAPAGRRPPAR